MEPLPRLDYNKTHELITNLITCGFRGSAQDVVNRHIRDYLTALKIELPTIPQQRHAASPKGKPCREKCLGCGKMVNTYYIIQGLCRECRGTASA